jgi:hypothetical protein
MRYHRIIMTSLFPYVSISGSSVAIIVDGKSIEHGIKAVTEAYTHVEAVILLCDGHSDYWKGCAIVVISCWARKAILQRRVRSRL